ncbi:hypothetical protein BK133_28015 [Paenibacillus sp. FSL H8-0548]|nr:hypothetical protein BK133_28015 [Paenibacillus sp. FSL H8-0548]
MILFCGSLIWGSSTNYTEASVSSTISFDYDNKNVRVKVYSRDVGETKNHPIFKYGDLINRAIAYKAANPSTEVKIKFAVYKVSMDAYVGFNPADASYGYVKGYDHGGDNSEKLVYSLVKAAKNQVHVDLVYHKDSSNDVYNYLNSFMSDPTLTDASKRVNDYFSLKKVSWGNEASEQMHAKFMTVSHYASDSNSLIKDTVFITTGNIDSHANNGIPVAKDWVQSGMLINGHPELMNSFNTYFDLIYNNATDQSAFHDAVREKHAVNALNYSDTHFSSYFFPIPVEPEGNYTYVPETGDGDPANGNAWNTTFNPIAKYVNRMASLTGDRYFKANVYHLKMDNFGQKLYNEMSNIYNSSSPGLKHFRWVANLNSYEHLTPASVFNNIGIIKYPKLTHAKDYLFAFNNASEYYTITGSTNLKLDEFVSKANASITVKEFTSDHPVYNEYKEIYNYQYTN